MIDTWLKEDLDKILGQHPIAVFVDESKDTEFLLNPLKETFVVYRTTDMIDELKTKYLIEKSLQEAKDDHKILIYTQQKKDDLTFIREYCETHGCIEIKYLQNYIKDKIHKQLNLNINLPKEELIAAAKVSVGKSQTYWVDICHKGASEIFDLEKELLPFLNDPKHFSNHKYDAQILETFNRKVHELIGQQYIDKPAETLAQEVAYTMLNGLATHNCQPILLNVYETWLDSGTYKDSFSKYLAKYKLQSDLDIWNVHPNHPFREIDDQWLKQIGNRLASQSLDKDTLEKLILRLKQRHQSKQAKSLGIVFWGDVTTLLKFNTNNMSYLSSFEECVEYYKNHFYKIDTAIRNLYTEFLQQSDVIEPFQELYKGYVAVFIDKWFKYIHEYQENQTGILQKIIDSNSQKIAVIVGDGVAYEIAEQVADKVSSEYKLTRESILADCPSETENNMSHIYMANGVVEPVQNKREKYLQEQNTDIVINYIRLDEVSDEALSGQILICTYKDIDDMGDKLNHKALKYFPESIDFFAEKIERLLKNGYRKVYLITDHGFVLTGQLSDSEKISVDLSGEKFIDERFIRTVNKQTNLNVDLVEVAKNYHQFNFLYFAKNMNPFKSVGTYGFAHGGLAPQEIITPFFCWEQTNSGLEQLQVSILNKNELKDVTGELYQVKLGAKASVDNLFTQERKVTLLFFVDQKIINKSDVISLSINSEVVKEYTFDGQKQIEVQVVDALSKELLDTVNIKQNNDRDLGGLF